MKLLVIGQYAVHWREIKVENIKVFNDIKRFCMLQNVSFFNAVVVTKIQISDHFCTIDDRYRSTNILSKKILSIVFLIGKMNFIAGSSKNIVLV